MDADKFLKKICNKIKDFVSKHYCFDSAITIIMIYYIERDHQRMFKNKILALVLTVILAFSITGCNKTADAYIYFELPSLPTTFDPQTAQSDSELLVVKNIYEGLTRKNSKGETVMGIAESYEKNGLTYTFTLRKNAKWNNGDRVTAHDFVFGIRRALDPKTKAFFASRLFCIKNAKKVKSGELSTDKLGITPVNDSVLKIELDYEDEEFLNNLSTSIAMPCNEKFFNECKGKYGLFRDNIVGNGSYRLTKWNKESFGIRLYKNEGYTGDFVAKNAAVFLTCNQDEPITDKLKKNSIDMAFIDSSYSDEMLSLGFGTKDYQNTLWVMTFNNDLSKDMRSALMKLVGSNVYKDSLLNGYTPATSIFPDIFGKDVGTNGVTSYDLDGGKSLYNTEVKKLEDSKFPSNVTLYYYDNGVIKPIITDIVGHWQNNLAAFVNIEAASSPEVLQTELKEQTLPIAVFPILADSQNLAEYLEDFGIAYNGENLMELQENILNSKNIVPLLFQNTTLCYAAGIKEIYTAQGDGFIDFSMVVKEI